AGIHGMMVYDTLFAPDEKLQTQPQMVGKWTVSEDKKTYVFTLRDGLRFSDGTPVTPKDVIASVKRWAARDGSGRQLMLFTEAVNGIDDKTFEWKLKEPYSLIIDVLGKPDTSIPYIMREKEALTDPFQQISE